MHSYALLYQLHLSYTPTQLSSHIRQTSLFLIKQRSYTSSYSHSFCQRTNSGLVSATFFCVSSRNKLSNNELTLQAEVNRNGMTDKENIDMEGVEVPEDKDSTKLCSVATKATTIGFEGIKFLPPIEIHAHQLTNSWQDEVNIQTLRTGHSQQHAQEPFSVRCPRLSCNNRLDVVGNSRNV